MNRAPPPMVSPHLQTGSHGGEGSGLFLENDAHKISAFPRNRSANRVWSNQTFITPTKVRPVSLVKRCVPAPLYTRQQSLPHKTGTQSREQASRLKQDEDHGCRTPSPRRSPFKCSRTQRQANLHKKCSLLEPLFWVRAPAPSIRLFPWP